MERLGYFLLGLAAAAWLLAILLGMIAMLPFGLLGLVAIAGLGFLFLKVLSERMANREDDHYEKEVHK